MSKEIRKSQKHIRQEKIRAQKNKRHRTYAR